MIRILSKVNNRFRHTFFMKSRFYARTDFKRNSGLIRSQEFTVYSFDVFDTVLTRTAASPTGVFLLLQEKLKKSDIDIPDDLKENFSSCRLKAEKKAWLKYGERCTLANIYEILSIEFHLPEPVRDTISNMEIEIELSLVRPVPEILDALAFLHSLKKRVVFISDMYLSSQVIQNMLKKVGTFAPGDRIYVSNEYGKTKKTGKLFKHVLDSEGCSPEEILHVGDNLNADIRSAKKLGIQTLYFQNTHPNRYEKYIYKKTRSDDPACQILTGASRAARLDCPFPAGREKVLYELGADVAAPILIQYIQWVLLEAQKHKIKRLYFLSRDGQILLEIAESLQKYIKTDIELRYLYASRLAWNFPTITELDEDSFNLFLYEPPIISIESLSLKTGLDPHSIQKAMEDYSGRTISIHQILSKTDLGHLHQILKSPPFSETLLDLAAQKRSALISYLEQEGIFDDHCSAVVDLGWKGSLQDALLKLINTTGKIQHCPIRGYYFGVGRLFQTHVPPQDRLKSGFYYSPGHPQPPFPTRILEVFTSGDHGLTLSYTRDKDGVWLPQLKEPRNRDVLDWGLQALRLGIRNFIKSIPRDAEIIFHRMNYYKASEHINYLINRLTLHPTKEEIAALAKYPFNRDSADFFVSDLAPSFNIKEAFLYSVKSKKRKATSWFQASYSKSTVGSHLILGLFFVGHRFKELFANIPAPKRIPHDALSLTSTRSPDGLKQKTLKGLAWTGGAQGGKLISQFIITAVLANLLSPGDFGLLGMATFFTGLISIFNEMGFSNALIQKKNITDRHYTSVFWLSIIIGIFLFLLMIPLSFPIAGFYKEPRLRPILILLSLNFIIFSFGLVQKAILQKEMEFKKIAVIDLTAILSGGIVGVLYALNGHGVYSLVYQLIVFTSTDMVLLWLFSKWRPRLEFSLSAIKDIWGFSLNLTGFNIINYFARNLDYLLVGKFLGTQALGFYTLAYRLMTYPLQNISWTIMKVMFPALSKIQDDLERVRFAYKKMVKAISLATFPMMLGLFALAPEFIHLIFGPKWDPVVPLVRIFCICGIIQSIGTTVGTIVLSQGKAKLHFQLGLLFTIFITIAILLGLHWGIVGVALFYSVFSILWIHGVNFGVASWLIRLKYSQFYAQLVNSYLMSILMMLVIFLAKQFIPASQPLGLVSLIGIGAFVYLGLLFLTGELVVRNKTLFLRVLD